MQDQERQREYAELELLATRTRGMALQPPNYTIEYEEAVIPYRIDARLRAMQTLNEAVVDAVCELDDYVNMRAAGRSPAVVMALRQLQQATAEYATALVLRHLARRL